MSISGVGGGSQLGSYLVERQHTLTTSTLTLYCLQVCKAMAYLEGLNMVHRYQNLWRSEDIHSSSVVRSREPFSCGGVQDFIFHLRDRRPYLKSGDWKPYLCSSLYVDGQQPYLCSSLYVDGQQRSAIAARGTADAPHLGEAQGEVADGEVGVQPSLRGGLEVSQQQRVAAHVADVRPHAPAGQHRGHDVLGTRRHTSSQRTSLKFLPMLEPWPRKHTLMILELAPPASRGGAGGPIPPARGDSSREFERLVSEHRLFQERVAESPDMSPKMRLSDPEGFLLAALRDGAALCRLLERLRPGTLQQPARVRTRTMDQDPGTTPPMDRVP
ncbi:hypothetical protein CRUP_002119, partial [Coryphaenoides rupestris]